jgi:peptide/nickel transport system ATP-binding protein
MNGSLLKVEDLRVSFETGAGMASVLDGVNFDVGRGEIVGLVGESGSGKTTLARAILGILPANAARIEGGRIWFDGRNLLTADPADLAGSVRGRFITFVPQDPFTSFNPLFTIGSQVMELMRWKSPLAPTGGKRGWRYGGARRRADRAQIVNLLKVVQLPDPDAIFAKYPHEISGGQRQRLMIAMALLPDPKLIIADEPTTALDVTIQAQILKLLRKVARERGVSVMFTTHDLGAAHEICDRITVMYAGQEVESAPEARFFAQPIHPYTRRLLESLPIRGRDIRGIPGEVPVLVNPPAGCRFHPRCEFATAECRGARPEITRLGAAHTTRCYHPLGVTESARAGS